MPCKQNINAFTECEERKQIGRKSRDGHSAAHTPPLPFLTPFNFGQPLDLTHSWYSLGPERRGDQIGRSRMEIASGHETNPPEPIRHRSGLGHKQICSCGGKCWRYFFRTLSSPDSARQVGSSADWTNPKIKAEAKARVCSKGGEHVRHEVLVDQRPQPFGHRVPWS